jgi:hypothetical protein
MIRALRLVSACLNASVVILVVSVALAAPPRVLPEGKLPADVRLQPPKDLNGYFPFTPPASPEEWKVRAERVKRQMLVSQGLWPLPGGRR